LTAGYYLAKVGHEVTIFEASPEAGGMMREGIPPYRLPREILDREIEYIQAVGVQIKTGQRVDAVDDLLSQGYDAVFIAIGAQKAASLDIEGEADSRVIDSLSFLRRVNSGEKVETGDVVAVVGGGYAAIDSARSARRLGATDVTILYRRTRHEMKASDTEINEAMAEGVKIRMLAAPHKITLSNGKINLECIEQKLGAMDEIGRRRPEAVECTEFSLQFDRVITAIGQYPDIPPDFGLAPGEGNTIQVNPSNLTSSRKGVFAGGDVVTGPASVIDAIAAGRRAAISIDQYLGGRGEIDRIVSSSKVWVDAEGVGPVSGYKNRLPIEMSPLDERTKSFSRVEIGFDEAGAIEEADRCLWCDLVDGDEAHPLSRGWTCKRGRADTARRYMRSNKT
jgi:NADPH-dependent glutamate synthase beta subunit-like oxidoreductase